MRVRARRRRGLARGHRRRHDARDDYPRGPLAWADEIGPDHVLGGLDALWEEYREERYRAAPALRSRRDSAAIGSLFERATRWPQPLGRGRRGPLRLGEITLGIPSGVGTCGVSRRYHSASSAAWQPEPAAVIAWR